VDSAVPERVDPKTGALDSVHASVIRRSCAVLLHPCRGFQVLVGSASQHTNQRRAARRCQSDRASYAPSIRHVCVGYQIAVVKVAE
jgi:hypothetical protein